MISFMFVKVTVSGDDHLIPSFEILRSNSVLFKSLSNFMSTLYTLNLYR